LLIILVSAETQLFAADLASDRVDRSHPPQTVTKVVAGAIAVVSSLDAPPIEFKSKKPDTRPSSLSSTPLTSLHSSD
jgi:hypothetical protein